MTLPETLVYRILSNNEDLNELMDEIRGGPFDKDEVIKQGIFTYDIPEDYKKKEIAPFIRINPIDEAPGVFMDDDNVAEIQTVQVDFWCANASNSLSMKKLVDKILKGNGHTQYDSTRYKDPDIDLIMNVRKYRVFDFN